MKTVGALGIDDKSLCRDKESRQRFVRLEVHELAPLPKPRLQGFSRCWIVHRRRVPNMDDSLFQDGIDALIADAPEDFAQRIIQLHEKPELWDSVAKNARKCVEREWSPDAVDRSLTEILAGVPTNKLAVVS